MTNSLVVNMAGSGQVSPTFWLNKKSGVSYPIVAQTPEHQLQALTDLENIPIAGSDQREPQMLGGLASIRRGSTAAVVSLRYSPGTTLRSRTLPDSGALTTTSGIGLSGDNP